MQSVPDGLIVYGFLAFLVGVVWVIVAILRRRGWKAPVLVTGLTVAVMNIGGILALSDVFGHDHPDDPYFYLYPSTPQETVALFLMLLGFTVVLVGIVRLIGVLFRIAHLKTTAVVTGLGFAVMLQGGILQLEVYELPHDHKISGSFKKDFVETAMLTMMTDKQVSYITPSIRSTNLWSDNPAGAGTAPLYPTYLRESKTSCFYCWDSSGNITRQDKISATCPASVNGSAVVLTCPSATGEPLVGKASYGDVVLVGATAVLVAFFAGTFLWIKRIHNQE